MAQINIENITARLNDRHVVSGWSDDGDALTIPQLDMFNVKTGALGDAVYFRNGERGGEVMLKLLPNSATKTFLMQQATRILVSHAIINWQLFVRDVANGWSVTCSNGVLKVTELGQTIGMGDAANAEFTFHFETIQPDWSGANFALPAAGTVRIPG